MQADFIALMSSVWLENLATLPCLEIQIYRS